MNVRCTQCGASVEITPDVRLLACPYCDTALVVDASGSLLAVTLRPTVSAEEALGHLRRFLAGRRTAAGVDREATIDTPRLQLFPFWGFSVADAYGGDQTVLMPAAPSALQGLQGIQLPAGELAGEGALPPDIPVLEPEVPLRTARAWLAEQHPNAPVRRTVLYHLPLYQLTYHWRGQPYRAAVDGVSGQVYPADFPAKDETPYALVTALALIVFGIEGLLTSNPLIKIGMYAVSALPILAVAWWVSRKV